jgi:hypothetical protein
MFQTINSMVTQGTPVEHTIGYAYPSSSLAKSLGCAQTGCFTVQVGEKVVPAKSYSEARAAVQRLGTVPGRWSWDHPSNSHLAHQNASNVGIALPCAAA